MPLNLTWVDLAFSCTKNYSGQVKRHSLTFQAEAALKYLVAPLNFVHDCTYLLVGNITQNAGKDAVLFSPDRAVKGSSEIYLRMYCIWDERNRAWPLHAGRRWFLSIRGSCFRNTGRPVQSSWDNLHYLSIGLARLGGTVVQPTDRAAPTPSARSYRQPRNQPRLMSWSAPVTGSRNRRRFSG